MSFNFFNLLGALCMFLYGMNMLSAGLQKAAGNKLRGVLSSMTSNPFKRVMTGLGVTALIQSSSATTVMVVGFVSAGLLSLSQAIGVIMGANIGTTMTAWIISIFGFKADIAALAVPLMALGFVLYISKKDKAKSIGELIIGFSLLFLGLSIMKDSVPRLNEQPQVLSFIQDWSGKGFLSVLLFLLLGTILTLILQSSSATVAITLLMLNMGWIQFDMAAAMVLGENIGTTITANIAAMVGNINAKRAALAHTVFNLCGVIWALIFFGPFVKIVQSIVGSITTNPQTTLVYGISMFHTLFNIINTCLLIWFTPLIEKIVLYIYKEKQSSDNKIIYLDSGLIDTPELALLEARKQTCRFAYEMKLGTDYIKSAIENAQNDSEFEKYKEKLLQEESTSDKMEYEVVNFLSGLDKSHLSEKSRGLVKSLLRISKELESMGDKGEVIAKIISSMRSYSKQFTKQQSDKLLQMTSLIKEAYNVMIENLEKNEKLDDISNAMQIELKIDDFRRACRKEEYSQHDEHGDIYFSSVFFLDTLDELEKIGDHIINVSEALQS